MRTLRVLAILVKRQLTDDAAYLVPALAFPLAFVPAIVIVVLTAEFTAPSLHAVAVFVALPVLVGLGSCTLGIIQTRADRVNGVSELLSILAVSRYQVFCARLAVGIAFLLIALVPLMLAGSILWRFVGPPAWLVHDWQADVFLGMALLALTSYGLGLSAGTRARTSFLAFAVVPLPILLVLLIVVKGFGWPLLSVLLVILAGLALEPLRSHLPSCVTTSALGLLVLVFTSTVLFWGRFLSDATLTRSERDTMEINASRLLSQKAGTSGNSAAIEVAVGWADPWLEDGRWFNNLFWRHSILYKLCLTFAGNGYIPRNLGIAEYVQSRKRGNCYVNSLGGNHFDFTHLDCVNGQLVCRHNLAHGAFPTFPWDWRRTEERFIGPEGISDAPVSGLGRFSSPLIIGCEFLPDEDQWPREHDISTFTLFETQSRRFFHIDLGERIVSGGPEVEPWSDEPVRMVRLAGRHSCRIDVGLPRGMDGSRVVGPAESPYVPVVRESGRIELLDRETLEIAGTAGTLPRPPTLFGRGSQKPQDLLATDIVFIAVGPPRPIGAEGRPGRGEYVGAVAASVSRQGTSMSAAVFDRQGKLIASRQVQGEQWQEYMVTKYVFESLHPPVLTLASFFTAYSFEAGSTHRALFFMPNSLVAQQRDREASFIVQLSAALLYLLPALAFSGFLSRQVVRDAAAMGLSRRARWLWGLGTLAFGLPAHITYRLMRPRAALALCRECGHQRRVDQDVCHHCGRGWDKPVLNPPTWRVVSS
jgi:hypothetical protein